MTQKVDQKLYFPSYPVFAPVCPEASQACVSLEAGHQVIGDSSNRVVAAQPGVQGLFLAHVCGSPPVCGASQNWDHQLAFTAKASIPRRDHVALGPRRENSLPILPTTVSEVPRPHEEIGWSATRRRGRSGFDTVVGII